MQVKLSKRLSAVAGMIPQGFVMADIGTDHGYLPAHLVMTGVSHSAIGTDVKEQPLASAANLTSLLAIEKKVDLRLGDGLSVLIPGEAEVLVIAGMGASTMIKILEDTPLVVEKASRLILQPMRGTSKVRTWLASHGWEIRDEELVYDDDIFYEIIAAEPGNSVLSIEEVENGPVLLKKKHPLLNKFIREKMKTLEEIYNSLGKSTSSKAEEQKQDIKDKISTLERVIACL